jgi:hypothetical protein
MFMRELAVFVSRRCVPLRVVVLTDVMVVGCLVMMMRRSMVVRRGLMVVLACRMLWRLCHFGPSSVLGQPEACRRLYAGCLLGCRLFNANKVCVRLPQTATVGAAVARSLEHQRRTLLHDRFVAPV